MNGWKLTFSGTGLSIGHFIYRVEAFTNQTLAGNFEVTCRNISSLFERKAKEFFWRHHKSVRNISRNGLCATPRQQFRDDRDNGDIEELIRQRLQKEQETFDHFYDEICSLLDNQTANLSGFLGQTCGLKFVMRFLT